MSFRLMIVFLLSFIFKTSLVWAMSSKPPEDKSNKEREPLPPPTVIYVEGEEDDKNSEAIVRGDKKKIDKFEVCKQVTNNGSYNVFVPHKTSQEWSKFRERPPQAVALSKCSRKGVYISNGACRHRQSRDYDNRSNNPRYLMSCTRRVDLNSALQIEPGETITSMVVSAQYICRQRWRESDEYNDITNYSSSSGVTNSGYSHSTNISPAGSYNNLFRNAGSKWFGIRYQYSAGSKSLSVSSQANGWGDCREHSCGACLGNIRVEYEIE